MFAWTPENIDQMKSLALDCQSASQIATAIGAPTRSTIIGKCHRIGVKLTSRSGPKVKLTAKAPRKREKPPRTRTKRLPSRLLANMASSIAAPDEGVEPMPQCPPVQKQTCEECVAEPSEGIGLNDPPDGGQTNAVIIFDLTDRTCRWPLWQEDDDLGIEEKMFCGALTGGDTYCAFHAKASFAPQFSRAERAQFHAKQRANA
jgi:hypothetical protein